MILLLTCFKNEHVYCKNKNNEHAFYEDFSCFMRILKL